jgi:O-antigen/teichoic acid export membrane protein
MDFTLIKELFAYGRHLLGASIVRFIATRSDAIVVGRLLGASSLGLYQSAMKLSTIAFGEIGETLNQVSFPAFANLQDNIAKVRAGYIRSVQVLTMSAYPVACALLVMAHEFTSILLSDKWLPMVPVIQVFCLLGPMQTVMADSVYKSLGRPDIQFRLSVMRFVLLMLAIFPMTKMYGTTGAALAMLITAAIVTPFNFHYVNKLIAFSMWDYVKLVFLPSLACAFMMTALLVLKYFLPVTGYLTLAFAAVAAAAAYLAAIAVLSRMYPQYRIFELLRDVRNVFFPQQ